MPENPAACRGEVHCRPTGVERTSIRIPSPLKLWTFNEKTSTFFLRVGTTIFTDVHIKGRSIKGWGIGVLLLTRNGGFPYIQGQ
jgi:hypothetical protein